MSSTATTCPGTGTPAKRSGGTRLRRVARRVVRREWLDRALDWMRFKIDTIGAADYQPLTASADDGRSDRRVAGTVSRWERIAPLVHAVGARTAVDIGCNVGWFSLRLTGLGLTTVGVEGHPPLYRTAMYAARSQGGGRMAVLAMQVTPETVGVVPSADCVLFLAVWHHIVRWQGMEAADRVLGELWARTNRVLFFETGESDEMPSSYSLPAMLPTADSWIGDHLERLCPGGEVRRLGVHASSPTYYRTLFAVVRRAHPPEEAPPR